MTSLAGTTAALDQHVYEMLGWSSAFSSSVNQVYGDVASQVLEQSETSMSHKYKVRTWAIVIAAVCNSSSSRSKNASIFTIMSPVC